MLDQDLDIRPADVSGLTGREAVREFFGRLGYPVEGGRQTSPEAETMTERLARAVRHIEVIASDEIGFLDVYLIELSSVTVANIQQLTTHFKNRGGNALAVLTSDYSQLDFVLFDLRTRDRETRRATVQVVPRRLTVDRLGGADRRVVLRVLRRFTWTEPDPIAQRDKLRSAFSIGEWSEEFFDNRGLFADYYLRERLRDERSAWDAPGLRDARDAIAALVAEATAPPSEGESRDEAHCRTALLEPVLAELGFGVEACKAVSDPDDHRPDYELLDPETGERLAVCLAYKWDRNLDGPDPSDPDTPDENPGAVVVSLLAH